MSAYGTKVVAVLDTTSAFGVTIKTLKENVDTLTGQMSTLLADAPETLDTLNEIAAAISDDPAFFTTMATANTTLQDSITALSTAASTARTALQTALQASIDAEALTGTNARGVLSGRLDTLEADPTTTAALTAVADAATAARVVLQAAIDAVQADVDANETASDAAEAALSGRLDTLEADPTTKTYVDTQVAGLIDSAPGVLNTLDELAAALGDDENFATTITNSIAQVQTEVDANEVTAAALVSAENTAMLAAVAVVQADVDQNETDADAAIAAVQADVDANEAERKTYFDWDSNLSKVINPLRGSRIDVGNNITFYPAAGYNTEIKGNLTTDNTTKVFFTLTDAADDSAAATAGVAVSQLYRNGSVVMIRVS